MPEASIVVPTIGFPIGRVNRHSYYRVSYPERMGHLGDRVREARRAAKLSQAALAKKVGVSQPTINDIESGEIKETTALVRIAIATGHSAYWLESGKGQKLMGPIELAALSDEERRAVTAFVKVLLDTRRAP